MFGRSRRSSVTPAQAASAVDDGALLIDVRDDPEWRAGHAPDAVHVPLSRLLSGDVPDAEGRPVIAVCRSGNRSAQATAALAARGVLVSNLSGGMVAWQREGLPVVRDGGSPGTVA